jgi:hypothetical protein
LGIDGRWKVPGQECREDDEGFPSQISPTTFLDFSRVNVFHVKKLICQTLVKIGMISDVHDSL